MECLLLLTVIIVLAMILILTRPLPKTAIVSLVKDPHAFDTWVTYHKEKMKVDKFYIFLDDDNEEIEYTDPSVIYFKNWKDRLGFTFNPDIDEPANVRVKQDLIVHEGIRLAKQDRMKYIVHMDCDELLYGPLPVSEVFNGYSADAFHMSNIEMAPDQKNYKNCFLEGTRFHGDPSKFIAYGNGKSAGVVGKSEPHGPHHFKASRVVEVPEQDLKILHYPSCNIEETLKRAKNYGTFKDDSAGWSDHHKETRDALASCDTSCEEKAEKQFEKRMAGPDSVEITPFRGLDISL